MIFARFCFHENKVVRPPKRVELQSINKGVHMKTCPLLTLDDARKIAAAAEAEATRQSWNVTIAICDAGGHLMWLQRMDGAPLMSAQVAPDKARTCVMTRKPSKAMEDMVNNGRIAALELPVLPIEGGEMIVIDGSVVGAVGVSGVKPGEDAEVARAGVAAIGASTTL
jgi:glc operon protein GlcG